jgi:glyoxylase-like metal-dependent hydrolase (beta-lactamase superfamily II)
MSNFTYVLIDSTTNESAIVDPSWNLEKIVLLLEQNEGKAKYIINTHTHFDHVLGNHELAALTGAKIIQHQNSSQEKDISVSDTDIIKLGQSKIQILFTPGHSEDSICLMIDKSALITGDTLFVGSCGRIDLPGGNVEKMYNSLYNRIIKLDKSLTIYPGHDYGHHPISTLENEIKNNPILKFKSKQSFMQYMGGGEN